MPDRSDCVVNLLNSNDRAVAKIVEDIPLRHRNINVAISWARSVRIAVPIIAAARHRLASASDSLIAGTDPMSGSITVRVQNTDAEKQAARSFRLRQLENAAATAVRAARCHAPRDQRLARELLFHAAMIKELVRGRPSTEIMSQERSCLTGQVAHVNSSSQRSGGHLFVSVEPGPPWHLQKARPAGEMRTPGPAGRSGCGGLIPCCNVKDVMFRWSHRAV